MLLLAFGSGLGLPGASSQSLHSPVVRSEFPIELFDMAGWCSYQA